MSAVGALVATGRTSDVYEYGRGSVVKVPRPDVPADWPSREATFTAAVRELGGPAPEILDVVDIAGRDAIVFERVHGPSMWEMILENPSDARAMGRELALVHTQILSAGLPKVVEGAIDRMRTKIGTAQQLTDRDRREALEILDGLPHGAALLHGDLHPGNVLMSPSGAVVIDWFDAAIGHPVADVVRSSVLVRPFDRHASRPHLPGGLAALLQELHDSYVGAMGSVLARPLSELRTWEALVAASRLAENAEDDDSPLLALWRDRHSDLTSPLIGALSG